MTPDGRYLVMADQGMSAAVAFARDARSGALSETGCLAGGGGSTVVDGCGNGVGIVSPENIAISAREGEVIISSSGGFSVVRVHLDLASGQLTLGGADSPCITDAAKKFVDFCQAQPGLGAPYGVAVSADGQYTYVASYLPGTVTAYRRDAKTGELVRAGSCFTDGDAGCVRRNGMKRAGAVVLAPDGRHLIVAAPDSSAVHVFAVKLKPPKVTVTGSFRRGSADLRIGARRPPWRGAPARSSSRPARPRRSSCARASGCASCSRQGPARARADHGRLQRAVGRQGHDAQDAASAVEDRCLASQETRGITHPKAQAELRRPPPPMTEARPRAR